MARQVHIHGQTIWWPDYYDVRHVKLDPALTPMQNCWRYVDLQVSVWLNKYKAFAYTEDRMIDLEQSCRVAVFCELKRRVRKGLYDRKWNFWYNVRSCAWSCIQRIIKQWLDDDAVHMNEVDGTALISDEPSDHSSMTFFDMVATESVPRLVTSSEFKPQRIDWRDAKTPGGKLRSMHDQSEDDYSRYLEDCAELGIQPVDKVQFVVKSYTGEELDMLATYAPYAKYKRQKLWLDKARAKPGWKERQSSYNHTYYMAHRDEISAKRKKKV